MLWVIGHQNEIFIHTVMRIVVVCLHVLCGLSHLKPYIKTCNYVEKIKVNFRQMFVVNQVSVRASVILYNNQTYTPKTMDIKRTVHPKINFIRHLLTFMSFQIF